MKKSGMRMGLLIGLFAGTAVLSGQQPESAKPDAAPSLYTAGDRVDVVVAVGSDAVVAGRSVRIAAPVRGDVLAAGWNVTLDADTQDDVRIAAGHVAVNGTVAGDLTAAGGDVTLGPRSRVSGRTFVTGNTVRIDGVLEQDVRIAGARVQIAGEIKRPAHIVAEQLEVLPTARIDAPLDYRSPNRAWIATGAAVTAPITYTEIARREAHESRRFPGLSSLLFVIQVGFAGALVVLLLPGVSSAVVGTLRGQPWHSLALGFVILIAMPLAAVVLLVSIFGTPVGIVMGAAYVTALLVGLVVTALLIGELEVSRFRVSMGSGVVDRLAFLAAGVVTLAVLRLIPVVGGLVVLVSVAIGIGALSLAAYRRALLPSDTRG